jgi:hypothetical protein
MPRYVIERGFPQGLNIPQTSAGQALVESVIANNDARHVTWVHSYVSEDRQRTFCVYDGPDPEAIRAVAAKNGLPIERITRVTVLDPYAYQAPA